MTPATVELSDDPILASYQATAVAPFGPADVHALLVEAGPDARLALLEAMLEEEAGYLDQRLAMAVESVDPDPPGDGDVDT